MKIRKNNIFLFIWLILSISLLVLNEYDANKIWVLYGVIPLSFFIVLFSERKSYFDNAPLLLFCAFTAWGSLSYFYTVNAELTYRYLSKILGNLVLWYTVSRLVRNSHNNIMIFIWILFLSLFYHAVLGIITPPEDIVGVEYVRSMGILSNPNSLGFTMWYGGVTATLLILLIRKTWVRLLLGISIIFFIFVLLESGSRKSAMAFVIFFSVLLFYLTKSKYRSIALLLVGSLVIGYYIVGEQVIGQTALFYRTSSENVEAGSDIRISLIEEGFSMFLNSPLLGIGLGSFSTFSSSGLYAHNDYIEVLASTGIIGLALYLTIYWYIYCKNRLLLHYPHTYALGAWSQAFLAGFLILGMGRPTFLDPVAILFLAFYQSITWYIAKSQRLLFLTKSRTNDSLPYYQYAVKRQ